MTSKQPKKKLNNLLSTVKNTVKTTKFHKPATPKSKQGASVLASVETDGIRFKLMWFLMVIGFVILVARAFWVQVIDRQYFMEKAEEENFLTKTASIESYRGMILDRNNKPLAISAPLITVIFNPRDYASEFYRLKKVEIELKAKETTEANLKELTVVREKLEKLKTDLSKISQLSGVSIAELEKAVSINEDIDFLDKDEVKKALPSGRGSQYFPLMRNVTPEMAKPLITDEKFFAITSETFYQRYYPQSEQNALLIGYMQFGEPLRGEKMVGLELRYTNKILTTKSVYQGKTGLEKQYNFFLAGQTGSALVLRNGKNQKLTEIKKITAEIPGHDIILTIDERLQYFLYTELANVVQEQKAQWASGIIVDVNNGEVLALSTWSAFNPNNLETLTINGLKANQTNFVFSQFEPGSVMKPFTVATALKSNKYTTNSLINTGNGTMTLGNRTIRDSSSLGQVSLRKLLQKSSNIASAKIALSLPTNTLSEDQKLFGFGQVTNLNFPNEAKGKVPIFRGKTDTARQATMAYGYGMSATLAQLAQGYAMLGSGGILHPLKLVKTIRESDSNQPISQGKEKPLPEPEAKRVLEEKHAKAVVDMMVSVTEPGGTATLASIDGYQVAGKTGTARRTKPTGEYYTDRYRNVFIGIAPASKPRFVVAIMVEDPQVQMYAGQVVGPVFRNVMKETLRLYNVPYDKPLTGKE